MRRLHLIEPAGRDGPRRKPSRREFETQIPSRIGHRTVCGRRRSPRWGERQTELFASRLCAVHSDSISSVPIFPVAQCRKLDQGQFTSFSTSPRLTGSGFVPAHPSSEKRRRMGHPKLVAVLGWATRPGPDEARRIPPPPGGPFTVCSLFAGRFWTIFGLVPGVKLREVSQSGKCLPIPRLIWCTYSDKSPHLVCAGVRNGEGRLPCAIGFRLACSWR
jgi:hypothetical protein